MTNVGIIGLGRQGLLHLMNCHHMYGVNVVGAADISKRALSKAKSYGIHNLYTDYKDMIDADIDIEAVVISLPNFEHLASAKLALEAGFHVFIEKPIARTTAECHEIMRSMQKSGRKLMVGHNCRFFDAIEKMKEHVENGNIGDIEVLTAEEVINGPFSHPAIPKPVAEWWFDPEKTGGGALLDIGYHLIDLFRFFAGEARIAYSLLEHRFNLPVEDTAIVILESPTTGTKGIINVGWYQRTIFPRLNFRVILHGNAGYIASDELIPRNLYVHAVSEGTKNLLRRVLHKRIRPLAYTYFYESYYKEMQQFIQCIENDSEPPVSVNDGLRIIEIIEEAYTRARN